VQFRKTLGALTRDVVSEQETMIGIIQFSPVQLLQVASFHFACGWEPEAQEAGGLNQEFRLVLTGLHSVSDVT